MRESSLHIQNVVNDSSVCLKWCPWQSGLDQTQHCIPNGPIAAPHTVCAMEFWKP
ncbi:uncharacterized protein EI90DRAFT_3069822 [Cantharellus anzutake]|uniref:uncharacterized protein n=1 Tax=Cantharellus anzutake TaxID=1750568 RepID=UPI0019030A16|nr:uncharacterized protein EI90DRAFT_3069822 [Cantharellus anzutake]KAF8326584.1 hypothetical protein EI90DRAFT_3069822 [Cantharellus anzutake]